MSCKNIIMQGDQYQIPIIIKQDGVYIDITTLTTIQFTVGELVKEWKSDETGDVIYNATNHTFYFPLSQEETFDMNGDLDCQIRIKFTDDRIVGKKIGVIHLDFSLTDEEIE